MTQPRVSFDSFSPKQAVAAPCAAVVRVWFPVIIPVLACIGPAIAAAQRLPPAVNVQTLPYERLDSTLNRIVTIFERSGRSATAARRAVEEAPLHEDGSVAVTFRVDGASNVQAVERYLRTNGGDPRNVGEDYIEAYVPVALLVPASEQPGVMRVQILVPPVPSLGPTISEGVEEHGAENWHDRGYTGAGVKVGVIDRGFQGIQSSLEAEELPTVIRRCYWDVGKHNRRLSIRASVTDHGTLVAESLMDIAPDALLYIANPHSNADLLKTVEWMTDEGVDVINRSVSSAWDGPGDGTSPFSDSPLNTVSLAVENGIVWVNSAGNYNQKNWYGQYNDPDDDGRHNFAPGDWLNDFRCGGHTLFQLSSKYPARLCLWELSPLKKIDPCSAWTGGPASYFLPSLFPPSVRLYQSTESDKSYGLAVERAREWPTGWIQLMRFGGTPLQSDLLLFASGAVHIAPERQERGDTMTRARPFRWKYANPA